MTAHHLPIVRTIRSFARRTGLLQVVKRFLNSGSNEYEDAFSNAMLSRITAGDTVWDIGANVGYYSAKFCERVGDTGRVIAFEPLPEAFESLKVTMNAFPSTCYELCQIAISDRQGIAYFEGQSEGTVTTTAHLSESDSQTEMPAAGKIAVDVTTVDLIQSSQNLCHPTITKIDVEGFEGEVIRGGEKVFSSDKSKHIFLEIHFARLDERRLSNTPNQIVKMLKSWGYQVKWIDPSHVHAFRI